MTKVKNRAWFIKKDGRAPLYFHVMYDENKSGISRLDFAKGRYIDLGEKESVYFCVEHEGKYADKHVKYANRDYVMKWDFLPQSVAPIANKKALQLLEKEAPDEFQAVPTKVLLPDGSYITDYTLINPLNKVKALNEEKSILDDAKYQWGIRPRYKTRYYNKAALQNFNLAYEETTGGMFLGSEKLRKAIKKEKLVGLQFKNTYGTSHFFLDENSTKQINKNSHTKNPSKKKEEV